MTWSDREGLKAERSQYFIGQNAGPDTRQTFDQAGLIVFTDAYVTQSPNSGNQWNPIECDLSVNPKIKLQW